MAARRLSGCDRPAETTRSTSAPSSTRTPVDVSSSQASSGTAVMSSRRAAGQRLSLHTHTLPCHPSSARIRPHTTSPALTRPHPLALALTARLFSWAGTLSRSFSTPITTDWPSRRRATCCATSGWTTTSWAQRRSRDMPPRLSKSAARPSSDHRQRAAARLVSFCIQPHSRRGARLGGRASHTCAK